jgi:hypothetical protein
MFYVSGPPHISARHDAGFPKAEVFGGYSWSGGNFHGWNTSVTGNVTKQIGIAADFSGHYGSELIGSSQPTCTFISIRAANFSFRAKD